MRTKTITTVALAAALIGLFATPAGADRTRRIGGALGESTIHGEVYRVGVLFEIRSGEARAQAAERALAGVGARPIGRAALGSQGFTLTGVTWPGAAMTQNYNPSGEPSTSALTALRNSQQTWNAVSTSNFTFTDGGTTNRCPSLVKECPGPQSTDGHNDVGWTRLSGLTLGVTWYTTSGAPEADMALNNRYSWTFTCGDVGNSIDAESVFLHENGHALGLGHSSLTSSVMYASYREARCGLAQDDGEGVTYLYPNQTGTVTGTVTDGSGAAISGATVSLGGTSKSATTNGSGVYSISGVAYPVTYDITASSGGVSLTTRTVVDSATETVDFTLDTGGGGGGGDGGGGPCHVKPDHPKCR